VLVVPQLQPLQTLQVTMALVQVMTVLLRMAEVEVAPADHFQVPLTMDALVVLAVEAAVSQTCEP
jgi:hypothetical protein